MNSDNQSNTWIKQLCAGDESAYRKLFDEYYRILSHFAMKFIPDIETCEDIVHDAILDLYSKKRTFENINALKSFLYLSIRNNCLNYLDHQKAKENYLRHASTVTDEEYFLDSIIEEEVYYLMHKAIKQLPAQIQSIYELSLQGKSNEEIAQALNLSLDSVKSYKKRGKQMLKDKLKDLFCLLSVTL